MLRLLFLTPQLPHPPRQGTAIRNWGLIKSLSARHEITLLAFADATDSITPELRATCRRIEAIPAPHRPAALRLRDLLLSPLPDLAHRLYSPAYEAQLASLIQSNTFDAIFVEGLELARPITNDPLPITIYDAHNCETLLQRRAFETDRRDLRRWPVALYSFIQSRRLARFEADACRRATYVTCVSNQEASALKALSPEVNPVVIPNGIFLSDYQPPPLPRPSAPRLVFTGKMDYRPNIDAVTWFANNSLPLIQRERPDVQFAIVGQKPAGAVRRLAARSGIIVTGAVEDARPHIGGAAVYVAPLRMGGGTRFKLLEAMALKRPIVSTAIGAEGFAVQNGREALIADSARDFADAVVTLLRDEPKRVALGEAGYEFVKGYDWGRIVPKVEALLWRRLRDAPL